jgi:hypothetical protein
MEVGLKHKHVCWNDAVWRCPYCVPIVDGIYYRSSQQRFVHRHCSRFLKYSVLIRDSMRRSVN